MSREKKGAVPDSRQIDFRDHNYTSPPLDSVEVKGQRVPKRDPVHLSMREARDATLLCTPKFSKERELLIALGENCFAESLEGSGVPLTRLRSSDAPLSDEETCQILRSSPFKYLIQKGVFAVIKERDEPVVFLSTRGARVLSGVAFELRLDPLKFSGDYSLGEVLQRDCTSFARGDFVIYHPIAVNFKKELPGWIRIAELGPSHSVIRPEPHAQVLVTKEPPSPPIKETAQVVSETQLPQLPIAPQLEVRQIAEDKLGTSRLDLFSKQIGSIAFQDDHFHLPTRVELLKELCALQDFERATSNIHLGLSEVVRAGLAFVIRGVNDQRELIVPTPTLLARVLESGVSARTMTTIEKLLERKSLEPENVFRDFPKLGSVMLHPGYQDQLPLELRQALEKQLQLLNVERERKALLQREGRVVHVPVEQGTVIQLSADESLKIGSLILGWQVVSPSSFSIWREGRESAPMQVGKRWRVPLGRITPTEGEDAVEAFLKIKVTPAAPRTEIDRLASEIWAVTKFNFELSTEPANLRIFKFNPGSKR